MPELNKSIVVDGDSHFFLGMSSLTATGLTPGHYYSAINLINRGGKLQTRPGFRWRATLPEGKMQGGAFFKPTEAAPLLVVIIDGLVYASAAPFDSFEQVPDIELSPVPDVVYLEVANKSVRRNPDNSIAVIAPYNVLMIQDGVTPPAYFDGGAGGHLTEANTTPIGGPMAWSGDRLWVANGTRLLASDIADPFSFIETTYNTLGGKEYFLLPDEVVALQETSGLADPQLLVFTKSNVTALQSNIRERSTWPTTPNFQRVIFSGLGTTSHRSIVQQNGLLYWMSNFGLISFNSAALSQQSSEVDYLDNEMTVSKVAMATNSASVAGASFENFLLMSIPYGGRDNAHTWVLDFSVHNTLNSSTRQAWSSIWTGINPVQWVTGNVYDEDRIFAFSKDDDGQNRVWEAFDYTHRDQDCDITWAFETRGYTNDSLGIKEFRFAEIGVEDIWGEVNFQVMFAGLTKGPWLQIANAKLRANEGNIDAALDMPDLIYGLRGQRRKLRTEDIRELDHFPLTACGVESEDTDRRDLGFQLCVRGNGVCSITSSKVFMDVISEDGFGDCHEDEAWDKFSRYDGADATSLVELNSGFPEEFTSEMTVESSFNGYSAVATASATSSISQDAADKLAEQRAWAKVNADIIANADPFDPTASDFVPSYDFSDARNSMYVPLVFG